MTAMSMLDVGRWRLVVYADTPRTLGRYAKFLASPKDNRKTALFVLGASNLHRVLKDQERFYSILVFDDMQNLFQLRSKVEGFDIVDIDPQDGGLALPKHLTPAEMAQVVERAGSPTLQPTLLTQLTNALGRSRPSVLETTSRMPMPEAVPESGAQRMLTDLKAVLDGAAASIPFTTVLDVYVRFLFRMVPRSTVTSQVTKKLPQEAKDIWDQALTFAASETGIQMARAYRALCHKQKDVDYRIGHAIADYGLKPYAGDFTYFTAILPPHRSADFLKDLDDKPKPAKPATVKFKPKPAPPQSKQARPKKARNAW